MIRQYLRLVHVSLCVWKATSRYFVHQRSCSCKLLLFEIVIISMRGRSSIIVFLSRPWACFPLGSANMNTMIRRTQQAWRLFVFVLFWLVCFYDTACFLACFLFLNRHSSWHVFCLIYGHKWPNMTVADFLVCYMCSCGESTWHRSIPVFRCSLLFF